MGGLDGLWGFMRPLDNVGNTASTGILLPCEGLFLCHQTLTGFHEPNLVNSELSGVEIDKEGGAGGI